MKCIPRHSFSIPHSAFCIAVMAFAAAAWAETGSATAAKIAVNTFGGELRAISPKDIEYSPLWCGVEDDGAYVVIEKVENPGMRNATTSTVTTCSVGAAGAYPFSLSADDEPCIRLIHRVYNGNDVEIGETLVRDVAFGTPSSPGAAIAADCREESLREAVATRVKSPVMLAYDTAWATNGIPADVTISAVRLTGEGGSAIGTDALFSAAATATGATPMRGVRPGWVRLVCRVADAGDNMLLEYIAGDLFVKPLATVLLVQ